MKKLAILTSSVLGLALLTACEQAEQDEQPVDSASVVESSAQEPAPAEISAPQQTVAGESTAKTVVDTTKAVTDNALTRVQSTLDKAMETNKAKLEAAADASGNAVKDTVETASEQADVVNTEAQDAVDLLTK